MKSKVLRPLTIIPSHLYIERDADRQLHEIISDMGRPGYVLVARQMGKTNLLLHARETHSSSSNKFAYLDVSNQFPDVRAFFRNVIDTTLEVCFHDQPQTTDKINSIRSGPSLLPHKEHEAELRAVLQGDIERIVICLDEIDALTRCEFSDQIFSFIRSIYFSGRANFPEFGRLTYLLSGVAEPADIIKNKDISPFNIGEKIYLDDFTQHELITFVKKANLSLGTEVVEKIYEWTRGHPRMTWGLCSELEDLINSGETVTPKKVDEIVGRIYFSEVDAPPVDHIKRLTEDNKEIRDALISIHYGRSESLTDQQRTKLYLSGITRMIPMGKSVEFKCRILEEALSEAFLLRADAKGSPQLRLIECESLLKEESYDSVLDRLPSEKEMTVESDRISAFMLAAKANFFLSRYEDCIDSLAKLPEELPNSVSQLVTLVRCACNIRLAKFDNVTDKLRNLIDEHGEFSSDAEIELITALSQLQVDDREVEAICTRIISTPSQLSASRLVLRSQLVGLVTAHLCLSQVYGKRNQITKAREVLEGAIKFASIDLRVLIHLRLLQLDNSALRSAHLRQAIALVKTSAGFTLSIEKTGDNISALRLFEVLLTASSLGRDTDIFETLEAVFGTKKTGIRAFDLLSSIVQQLVETGDSGLAVKIIEFVLRNSDGFNDTETRALYAILINLNPVRTLAHHEAFLSTFSQDKLASSGDLTALNNIIVNNTDHLSQASAKLALSIIDRDLSDRSAMTELQAASLSLLQEYLRIYFQVVRRPNASDLARAKSLLEKISMHGDFHLPGFATDHSRRMQKALSEKLRRHGIRLDIRMGKKYGRNDYVNVAYGEVVQRGKYKRFEADLRSGACRLVDSPPQSSSR